MFFPQHAHRHHHQAPDCHGLRQYPQPAYDHDHDYVDSPYMTLNYYDAAPHQRRALALAQARAQAQAQAEAEAVLEAQARARAAHEAQQAYYAALYRERELQQERAVMAKRREVLRQRQLLREQQQREQAQEHRRQQQQQEAYLRQVHNFARHWMSMRMQDDDEDGDDDEMVVGASSRDDGLRNGLDAAHTAPLPQASSRAEDPNATTVDDGQVEHEQRRQEALKAVAELRAELDRAINAFTLPSHAPELSPTPSAASDAGTDSAASELAFSARNRPVLAHEEQLVRLLAKADAIDSAGDVSVRAQRKAFVLAVEQELAKVDEWKRSASSPAPSVVDEEEQQIEIASTPAVDSHDDDNDNDNVNNTETPAADTTSSSHAADNSASSRSRDVVEVQHREYAEAATAVAATEPEPEHEHEHEPISIDERTDAKRADDSSEQLDETPAVDLTAPADHLASLATAATDASAAEKNSAAHEDAALAEDDDDARSTTSSSSEQAVAAQLIGKDALLDDPEDMALDDAQDSDDEDTSEPEYIMII